MARPGIFIDAGHSPPDPGASGNGLIERDLNKAIARRVVRRLRAHGIRTKTDLAKGNLTAGESVRYAHRLSNIRLFVSFHHNGFGRASARGYEVYKTGWGRSRRLARKLRRAHVDVLRAWDPKIPDRGVKEARRTRAEFIVLRSPGSSALVECLFVSNPADAAIAKRRQYPARMAEATVEVLVEFGRAQGWWKTQYQPPKPPDEPAPDPCAAEREAADKAKAEAEAQKQKATRWRRRARRKQGRIDAARAALGD